MRDNNIAYHIVPPHVHLMNAVEKAIGTFKDHFLAGLCSVHPNFPMHLWCRLVPLATTTLNLLRPSRINTRLSAEVLLNGSFDYKKNAPRAPPHQSSPARNSGKTRYLGATRRQRMVHRSGTGALPLPPHFCVARAQGTHRTIRGIFPHSFTMPPTSSADAAIVTAQDLVHACQNPEPATPFDTVQSGQAATLATLSENFLRRANSVSCSPPTSLPRVCEIPVPTDPPPRVPETSPALPSPFPAQDPARQQSSLIKPDDDDPVRRWYQL